MRSLRTLLGISILVALSSCSTRYAPISDHSPTGYAEAQLDSVTWNVGFFANYTTDTIMVNRYMLYRAAELTAQHGFDYFLMLDYQNDFKPPAPELNPPAPTISCPDPMKAKPGYPYGVPSLDLYMGGRCATVTIRMMHGTYPANNPNAFAARWMLASMGPSLSR